MDLLSFVSGLATVSTIGLFSVGILTCKEIYSNKSVGSVPHLPFVAASINCALWLAYGILKPDNTVFWVNFVGFVEQVVYLLIYHSYTENRYVVQRDISVAAVIILPTTIYYSFFAADHATVMTQLGIICNFFTIMFFASPLSTMAEVVRSQNTETMSLPLSAMAAVTSGSWLVYGTLVSDGYIQFPNAIGLLLSLIQLSLFAVYRNKKKTIVSLETPMV